MKAKIVAVVCILAISLGGVGFTYFQRKPGIIDGLTLSTYDGLRLTFNEHGFIESIKISNNELVDSPTPAFWIRDFTPDYKIENLIKNPGLENDIDNNGIADHWVVYNISGEMDISLDNDSNTGSKSVKMAAQSSKNQNKMAYASSLILVQENTEYLLSCYAKDDFGHLEDWWALSIYVYCIFYDEQEEIIQEELQIHHTLHSWKQFSKIIVSPSTAKKARIALVFYGPKDMTLPGITSSTTWFDDITFGKMPEETKIKAVDGALKRKRDTIVYEGSLDGLEFSAEYTSKGSYLEINGEIVNTRKTERALDISFLLPVDMQGWTWWDDMRTWRKIDEGIYETVINADESSYLPLSVYPTSAMTDNIGLSLAVPLSKPRIFRIFYDSTLKKCGITFSFGLHPKTTFQSVDFTIYVHACDPEWGFRDALNRYYTYFPEYFERTVDSQFWNASWELADFGIRHIQGSFSFCTGSFSSCAFHFVLNTVNLHPQRSPRMDPPPRDDA